MAKTSNYAKTVLIIGIGAVAGLASASPAYWLSQLRYVLNGKEIAIVTPVSQTAEKINPDMLIIPSLGISAPIQYVEQIDEESFQRTLEAGVVHYPGTAEIGQYGNPYVFGHSSDYIWAKGSYKTVFALLPRIKEGDEIIASDRDGNKFTYVVTDTKIVSPKDTQYLDQHSYIEKIITIQTSWPVGTALKRFVVIAKLQE